MSLEEIRQAIIERMLEDELFGSPNFCRRSAIDSMGIVTQADVKPPKVKRATFLVTPNVDPAGPYAHYAVKAIDEKGRQLTINPSATPGYPQWIQISENPPGLLSQMIETDCLR